MNIGTYLKQLRIDRGLTLNDVAGKVDMSSSFLSQIENMKISPSLESLVKLCQFYSINLSDFFRQVEQKKYIIVKKEETQTFTFADGALKFTLLASKLQNNSLETYMVQFLNNAEFETAVLPREINGERFLYVIDGAVSALIDDEETVRLVSGDSINYKSYVSCRIESTGESMAELIISGMPPLVIYPDSGEKK